MRVAKSRPDMTEVGNAPSDDGISISIDTNAPPAKKNPRCKATLTAPVFSTAPPAESSGTSPNATVRRDGRQPRKRTAPVNRTVDDYGVSARDQKLLRMALAKSLVETTCEQREHMEVPTACVFHPTLEEFADPIRYISRFVRWKFGIFAKFSSLMLACREVLFWILIMGLNAAAFSKKRSAPAFARLCHRMAGNLHLQLI